MNTGSGEQWDLYPGETAGKHKIKIKMIKVWNIKVPSHQEGREKRAERGEEGRGGGEKTGRGRRKAQPEARRRSDAFTSVIRTRVCKYVCVCSSVRCCVFFLLLARLLNERSHILQQPVSDDVARVSWGSSSSPKEPLMMSSWCHQGNVGGQTGPGQTGVSDIQIKNREMTPTSVTEETAS